MRIKIEIRPFTVPRDVVGGELCAGGLVVQLVVHRPGLTRHLEHLRHFVLLRVRAVQCEKEGEAAQLADSVYLVSVTVHVLQHGGDAPYVDLSSDHRDATPLALDCSMSWLSSKRWAKLHTWVTLCVACTLSSSRS